MDRFLHVPEINGGKMVHDIREDSAGNLWVGTSSNGVYRYDARNDVWTQFLHDADDPNSLPYDNVTSVFDAALREFLDEYGLDARNVVFMGDDIPDLECMRAVGIPVAPADAASEILEAARYVSEYPGGRGCVRDIVEQVLRARGQWALHGKGVNCSKEAKSE